MLADDVRMMTTGFGSVLVEAGAVTTRGLWDDAQASVDLIGGMTQLQDGKALWIAAVDVPDLRAEDTITVGAVDDDTDRTTYRVADIHRAADGLLLRVFVA